MASAQDALPPPPTTHFHDAAGVVDAGTAARLDARLRAFEQETSHQIVVAVYPRLPSPSLEDYTFRTAESWRVGRKALDNGLVWFVFVEDRKTRVEVGYGLEAVVPDVVAKRILADVAAPRFRDGDWAGGLQAGISALTAAARQEPGSPAPAPTRPVTGRGTGSNVFIVLGVLLLVMWLARRGGPGGGRTYGRRGRGYGRYGGYWIGPWIGGGWGGGGGFGGGSGWGGGGGFGGFSGGGGSFGGGGASADW